MSCRTPQIYQTAVGKQYNAMAIREIITVYLRFYIHAFDTRIMFQRIHLNFIVEVTDITYDSLVFHLLHVVNTDNIDIASSSHENIAFSARILHCHYFKAFHCRLQCADRVYFRHKHTCPVRAHGM